jgi:hypothetical protein
LCEEIVAGVGFWYWVYGVQPQNLHKNTWNKIVRAISKNKEKIGAEKNVKNTVRFGQKQF